MTDYFLQAFYPKDLESAKRVVLTPDPARPEKFEEETRFLLSFIKKHGLVTKDTRVLDFGCGIGRISKALIDEFDCSVVGTDISYAMLVLAGEYVGNEKFQGREKPEGVFDLALSVLVFQHAHYPQEEVEAVYRALRPGGTLLVVNEQKRFVPSGVDGAGYVVWEDDGISIDELLTARFTHIGSYPYCGRNETPVTLWRRD